jgi:hypothetical protein
MRSPALMGRRVKVVTWYGHPPLFAALRGPPVGTVTRVDDRTGRVAVLVEGLGRVLVLARGDVEVLPRRALDSCEESETAELAPDTRPAPAVWVTCPCEGSGRMGGRTCPMCGGSGELNAAVAEYPADAPTDDG